jgi:formylglycine-generating enzyme required for sulfatase activity
MVGLNNFRACFLKNRDTPVHVKMFLAAALAVLVTLHLQQSANAGGTDRRPGPQIDEPPAGTMIVHPKDGALMVYVPSGWFVMGMDRPEAERVAADLGYESYHQIAAEEWFPRRLEYVRGFFIDRCEVTNHRWSRYVRASGHESPDKRRKRPPGGPAQWAAYPVVRVLWAESQQYANWAGKSLPSERQWEKAARGTDGRRFPWGDEPLDPKRGVFVHLENDKPTRMAVVGSKPAGASPYGCLDMAGNVYEWTSDWHEPYPNNPEYERMLSYMGHKNGVLRGGSFYHARAAYVCAKRFGFKPDETYYHVGFRTVWRPPAGWFGTEEFENARQAVEQRREELAKRRKNAAPAPKHF